MRVLALDVGERRIGLALGDTETRLAVPAGVIERRGGDADLQVVLREARDREADLLVVGMPLSLSGRIGPQAEATLGFVRSLQEYSAIPIVTWDERFSTSEAEHRMRAGQPARGRSRPPRAPRGSVDAAAAAVILQSFLDTQTAD